MFGGGGIVYSESCADVGPLVYLMSCLPARSSMLGLSISCFISTARASAASAAAAAASYILARAVMDSAISRVTASSLAAVAASSSSSSSPCATSSKSRSPPPSRSRLSKRASTMAASSLDRLRIRNIASGTLGSPTSLMRRTASVNSAREMLPEPSMSQSANSSAGV